MSYVSAENLPVYSEELYSLNNPEAYVEEERMLVNY